MASVKDIFEMVARLSAAYPNWNPTAYTNEIYYQDLKDIDSDELFAAEQHCRTTTERDQRFAPSAGEIRKAVMDLRKLETKLPSSYSAWEEVRCFIRDNSYFVEPHWSNPLIEKTVRVFGLDNLRQSENGMSDRARFIECYEQFAEHVSKEEMMTSDVRGYIENKTQSAIKQLSKGMEK